MTDVTPCLWFDNNLDAALDRYSEIFGDVVVHSRTPNDDGGTLWAEFAIGDQQVIGINGGPMYTQTPAFSFFTRCESQDEVDRLWEALTADGGEESMCGWLKDRFGLSWQIVPGEFLDMLANGTPEQTARVTEAMLQMRKLDMAVFRSVYNADG